MMLDHFWEWYPPVGVFIGILGLIGVLVPLLRDLTKIGKWEKALWTFVMFALVLLEIRSIYLDRSAHDREQAAARAEQLSQFEAIAQRIDTSIANSQKQFDATMSGIGKNIDTVTGASDYGYIIFNIGQGSMAFIHVGDHPLYEVEARFVDTDNLNAAPLGVVVPIGNSAPHVARLLNALPFKDQRQNFTINFTARNGSWLEQLRLRKVDGKWIQALRVLKVEVNGESKRVMHEDIPKNYVLEGNGKMDWDK